MQILRELSFRQLENAFVFVSLNDVSFLGELFEDACLANGVLTYAFIHHEKGICFEIICCASFNAETKAIKLHASNDNVSVSLTYENLADEDCMILPKEILPAERLATKLASVEKLSLVSEMIAQTRNITAIDSCRTLGKPDEVLLYLVKGNDYFETVHARLEEIGKMNLTGTLLEEPEKDFGVHSGELINFFIAKNEQGIMCMATF